MPLYKVDLNWQREIHTCYTEAKSPRQALGFATERLARVLGQTHNSVLKRFLCGDQKYEIILHKRKEDLRSE